MCSHLCRADEEVSVEHLALTHVKRTCNIACDLVRRGRFETIRMPTCEFKNRLCQSRPPSGREAIHSAFLEIRINPSKELPSPRWPGLFVNPQDRFVFATRQDASELDLVQTTRRDEGLKGKVTIP